MQVKLLPGFVVLFLIGITIPTGDSLNITNFGLGDFNLQDVLKLDNLQSLLDWLTKLTERCQAKKVNLDMAFLLQRYMCLSNMESTLISGDEVDVSYLDKVCKEWPKAGKCVKPLFKRLEKCFSQDQVNLEGVLTGGVEIVIKQLCKHDTSFINALIDDGPEVLICFTNRTEKVVRYVVECFNDYKPAGVTDICEGFDIYKECFIKSATLCENPRSEKLVYRLVEEVGLKNIFYKNILQCDKKLKNSEKVEKPTSTKTEL